MLQLKFKKQQQKQNKLENKYVAQRNLENEQKIENSEIKDYDDFLINLDMHFSNREPEESKSNQNKRTNQKQNNQNSSTIKKKPIKMNFCKLVERHRIVYIEDEKEGQTIDKSRNTNGNIKKITDALINNQNNLSDTQNKHQIYRQKQQINQIADFKQINYNQQQLNKSFQECHLSDKEQHNQRNKQMISNSSQSIEIGTQTDEMVDINIYDIHNLIQQEQNIANSLNQLHEKILKLLHNQI